MLPASRKNIYIYILNAFQWSETLQDVGKNYLETIIWDNEENSSENLINLMEATEHNLAWLDNLSLWIYFCTLILRHTLCTLFFYMNTLSTLLTTGCS